MKLIIRKRKKREKKSKSQNQASNQQSNKQQKLEDLQKPLAKTTKENITTIQATLGNSSDLITRTFKFGQNHPTEIALFYLDGMADAKIIQNFITETLMIDSRIIGANIQTGSNSTRQSSLNLKERQGQQQNQQNKQNQSETAKSKSGQQVKDNQSNQQTSQNQNQETQQNKEQSESINLDKPLTLFKERYLVSSEMKEFNNYKTLFEHLLAGDSIILLDGYDIGFAIGSKGFESRGVEEPTTQVVVRGPKEGFTEKLRTNTALIRRRIKDPNLWIENKVVGKKTQTDIAVCYIKGIAKDGIVQEVNKRINQINIDGILESGYIEELIQDETYSPFPTVYNTERPDAVCAGLLEGRIAILVDGTPFALLVPALFVHFFQASEDFYQRADIATMMRMLRYLCFFLALLTPSAYIALTTFHQEMIPTQLLISLAAQREGVPFPAYVEALMMEITFEILREAGTRMPRAVGSAISIVGALVLGQAAVEAGIVSSAMVIVVSLTAISSFVSPTFNMSISIRMLRFFFMTVAAVFGLVGIILGLVIMVMHLTSLRSFGIPYLAPMGPFIPSDQKDTLFRLPLWKMKNRPRLINQTDIEREETPSPKPPGKAKG